MKTKTQFFGLMLLAGILCASLAAAQEGPGAPPPQEPGAPHEQGHKDHGAMMQKMEQELGLSPDQKTKMAALRAEGEGSQKAAFKALKEKKEALRNLLDSANPNEAQAKSLAAEINTMEASMTQARIDHIFKIRAILTPEQFKKLEEIRKKHREEHKGEGKEGRQFGPGHGPEGE